MSCTIETIIACDLCGENNGADDRSSTAKKIRASRKAEGWTYKDGRDYCPDCTKAVKQMLAKERKLP